MGLPALFVGATASAVRAAPGQHAGTASGPGGKGRRVIPLAMP
ncbi:hypothetical protein [Nonomuraea basaltis]|nr:hypothetical protein [Nonomuraea basaltis]